MSGRPAVRLSALRRIGWTFWDPIGIRDLVSADFAKGPADEYNSYLMVAFGMAQSGRSVVDIAAYISDIASRHVDLSEFAEISEADADTARQLFALANSLT